MKFYDRETELEVLREIEKQSHKSATFTVLMGRRRVGKTSLIMRAMQDIDSVYLFVSKDSEAFLCQKFQRAIEEQLSIQVYGTLTHFRDLFEVLMRESKTRSFTVIIDEFQNLHKVNPAIFSEMQDIWDRYHTESHMNLIASGSIMSLMRRIFENENEPLYGRPTSKITLRPFSIATFKQIFRDHCPNYKNEDLLCLYMLTGGVAKYVELLMDAGCYTKEKMLNYVCRMDSYFLSEGKDIINNEFGSDYTTYYSILQLIASGMNHRGDIDGTLQKDSGVYLLNLEQNFGMITRIRPILASQNSKISSYEISDPFLRFWFRFICPYQAMIESGQLKSLRDNINAHYEQFTGCTLERYFQAQLMETGAYTLVGNWWDKKGDNEIDVVALNEFNHTGLIAEVKRNERKLDMTKLEEKVGNLPHASFGKYQLELKGMSMKDM